MEQYKLAASDGTPIMRPLFFDFWADPGAQAIDDQQMFGPDYLVAPVLVQGASNRSVYLPHLPSGTVWKNVFTSVETDTSEGGKTIVESTPLDTFPLYKRSTTAPYPPPPPPPKPPTPNMPPIKPAGGGLCAGYNNTDFRCDSGDLVGDAVSCDLKSAPCRDASTCCGMCIDFAGCNFWTFTLINGKTTCFLKGHYARVLPDPPSDMHVSGRVLK